MSDTARNVTSFAARLRTVPNNTETFLHGLPLRGNRRFQQWLLESIKKIGGNHAFFRDNQATIIDKKSSKIQSKVWRFFPVLTEL